MIGPAAGGEIRLGHPWHERDLGGLRGPGTGAQTAARAASPLSTGRPASIQSALPSW